MNQAVQAYRKNVKRALPCFPRRKRELLARLDKALEHYQEDTSPSSQEEIEAAFGSSEYMAAGLLKAVPQQERIRYYSTTMALRWLAVACATVLLCFSVYTFCIKEADVVTIYEGSVSFDEDDGRNALSEKALVSLSYYEETQEGSTVEYAWEIADDGTVFLIFVDMQGRSGLQMCRGEQIDDPYYIAKNNEWFLSTPAWNAQEGTYNFLMSNTKGSEVYHYQVGLCTTDIDSIGEKYNVSYSVEKF